MSRASSRNYHSTIGMKRLGIKTYTSIMKKSPVNLKAHKELKKRLKARRKKK